MITFGLKGDEGIDDSVDTPAGSLLQFKPRVSLLRRRSWPPRADALHRLIPAVYAELCRLAHYQLARETDGHTLSTTALVHEAYLRVEDHGGVAWAQCFAR